MRLSGGMWSSDGSPLSGIRIIHLPTDGSEALKKRGGRQDARYRRQAPGAVTVERIRYWIYLRICWIRESWEFACSRFSRSSASVISLIGRESR